MLAQKLKSKFEKLIGIKLHIGKVRGLGATAALGFSTTGFLPHILSPLVFPQADKPGMPEPIAFGPFEELDLCHNLGSQPDCFLHCLGVEFAAEGGGVRFG